MIRSANKHNSHNTIHGIGDRKTMYIFATIAAVLIVFGYIVGQASGLTSYAQDKADNLSSSQVVAHPATGTNRYENSQQFSATNSAQGSESSLSTTLLTLGAVTFAVLGAAKVYKVMTD